jgi:hypothetical protein
MSFGTGQLDIVSCDYLTRDVRQIPTHLSNRYPITMGGYLEDPSDPPRHDSDIILEEGDPKELLRT